MPTALDMAFGILSPIDALRYAGVHFTNHMVANWPSSHQLDHVHVPLAEAADPPPTDPDWYGPMAPMNLPLGVRFCGAAQQILEATVPLVAD